MQYEEAAMTRRLIVASGPARDPRLGKIDNVTHTGPEDQILRAYVRYCKLSLAEMEGYALASVSLGTPIVKALSSHDQGWPPVKGIEYQLDHKWRIEQRFCPYTLCCQLTRDAAETYIRRELAVPARLQVDIEKAVEGGLWLWQQVNERAVLRGLGRLSGIQAALGSITTWRR